MGLRNRRNVAGLAIETLPMAMQQHPEHAKPKPVIQQQSAPKQTATTAPGTPGSSKMRVSQNQEPTQSLNGMKSDDAKASSENQERPGRPQVIINPVRVAA